MILDNIGTIQIIGSENQFEGKKLIMNLFFWLPVSENQKNGILKRLDASNIRDKRISPYFKSIFIINRNIMC